MDYQIQTAVPFNDIVQILTFFALKKNLLFFLITHRLRKHFVYVNALYNGCHGCQDNKTNKLFILHLSAISTYKYCFISIILF